jgi:N-formylglutamate deformylase
MCATHSRIVVDLNRNPAGDALYPGASNTEVCPTTTFHDEPIYLRNINPDATEVGARIDEYWVPYHAQLKREIERVKSHHGYCILLDGHSIMSVAPRFFPGKLPDLNLGTADRTSCDEGLAALAFNVLSDARGFSAVHNGRFKGGYITRHYGQPLADVHALQLEMTQSCYMDENSPEDYLVTRAARLIAVLQSLVQSLVSWRPAPR